MRPSEVEEKRPWDTRASFDFIPGLTLSEHPFEQRKGLFMKKLMGIMECKSLHPTEFEGYTIKERFMRMGWENLLSFKCDKIYTGVVKQWMASLSRNGDELIGIVDGKSYTITPRIIRDLLGVDTRTDFPYIRYKEVDSKADTAETKTRWNEACKTVFGREENVEIKAKQGYKISMMTPLAKVLWRIGVSTFLSRDYLLTGSIYPHEIHLLRALLTGDYLYSFAHLMIHEIWDMYEQQHREYIPYGNYISEILCRLGAVSEDEYVKVIPPIWRVISVKSFSTLEFLKSPTEQIIYDRKMQQRITFPNAGTGKAPSQPKPTNQFSQTYQYMPPQTPPQPKPTNQFSQTYQYMPPQTPITYANVEMTNLFTKFQNLIDNQSSIFQKQYDEMKTMVTNIQKQMQCQVLEAERREQEREKLAEEREKLAENREKQAEEREKQAAVRDKEGEKRAEERERWAKERERQADEREKRSEEREKQSEIRDKEGEKWAEEREKWAKERERQADEREKRAEERERQSEIRDKGEKRAEERENWAKKRERQVDEREKQAEMWTHAIIWDIERQRYFYEMEQEQLRMAWNQLNGANAVDEFQIQQMSRTSLHPPQEGSPYYDPTQGDEIPKAFQPLYQDIYGPRRKKPFSA